MCVYGKRCTYSSKEGRLNFVCHTICKRYNSYPFYIDYCTNRDHKYKKKNIIDVYYVTYYIKLINKEACDCLSSELQR